MRKIFEEPEMNTQIFKPIIPPLEEHIDALIRDIFLAYNCVATSPLNKMTREDLTLLRPIIEALYDFHCAIAHNENKKYEYESRRTTWIEMHHTAFMRIRHHINDLQDDKVPFDFTPIYKRLKALLQTAIDFVRFITTIELKQSFYTRVQLYKYHRRAAALHCPLHHTQMRLEENKKTIETEKTFAEIHKRIAELYDSFQDRPHHLHDEKERSPHIDFTHL